MTSEKNLVAPSAPLVTVDSTAFQLRLANIRASGDPDVFIKELVEWLDAHTARAVAAAVEGAVQDMVPLSADGRSVFIDGFGLVDIAWPISQPVAGELPPLSAQAVCDVVRDKSLLTEHATRLLLNGDAVALNSTTIATIANAVLATQPVQQPAAVVGQGPIYQAKGPDSPDIWSDIDAATYAKAQANNYDTRIVYTAPVPAAGVQGSKFDISTPDRIRLFNLDGMLLNYRCAATDAKRDEFKTAIVAAFHALAAHPANGAQAGEIERINKLALEGMDSITLGLMDAKEIAGKALQGLRMTETESDAQFTLESQKQMFSALVAIHGPVIQVVGDAIKNEHGHFVSPKGRGFTQEEMRLVAAGTYADAPEKTEE